MSTIAYCDDLLTQFGDDGRLQPCITPLVPFLDPGSIAFEEPEQNGYRLLFHTLEDHRRALLAPTWKYALNYETKWMTASDIVRATYDATVAMARLRTKHGLISDENAKAIENLVKESRRLMTAIEQALSLDDIDQLQDTLRTLKPEIDAVNLAGSWRSNLYTPASQSGCQQAYRRHTSTLRSPKRVWEFLTSRWSRHDNAVNTTTVPPPRQVMCSWFRPPPM
jgi:hypothetical protein